MTRTPDPHLAPLSTWDGEAPSGFAAPEIAPAIRWLRLPLPWALDHVNCYALEDPDGWTLIDTGIDSRRMRAHWQGLLAVTLGGKPVTRLVATHHHPDHIGLAGWFQSQGVELLASRTAWLYARMLTLDEQRDPAPESLLFQARAGVSPETLAARERPFNFCDMVAPMPLGFTRLQEGSRLQAGGREWLVRLGQGHAPDHVTLWAEDVVLMGDQVLPSISPNIGVYASEPAADPLGDYLASLAALAPHDRGQLILPGHQKPFRGLAARIAALIQEHETALDRLVLHLAQPRRATACFPALFRREIGAGEFGLALGETLAHLNRLLAERRIQRHEAPDGAWLWARADTPP